MGFAFACCCICAILTNSGRKIQPKVIIGLIHQLGIFTGDRQAAHRTRSSSPSSSFSCFELRFPLLHILLLESQGVAVPSDYLLLGQTCLEVQAFDRFQRRDSSSLDMHRVGVSKRFLVFSCVAKSIAYRKLSLLCPLSMFVYQSYTNRYFGLVNPILTHVVVHPLLVLRLDRS
jgi:hypothetical protein